MRKSLSIRLTMTMVSAVAVFISLLLSAALVERTADNVLKDTSFALDEKLLRQIAVNIAEEERANELYMYALMRDGELTGALRALNQPEFINPYEISEICGTISHRLNSYKLAREQITRVALFSEDYIFTNLQSYHAGKGARDAIALVQDASGMEPCSATLAPGTELSQAWQQVFAADSAFTESCRVIYQQVYGFDGFYLAVLLNDQFFSNAIQSQLQTVVSRDGVRNLYVSGRQTAELLEACADSLRHGAWRGYCSNAGSTFRVTSVLDGEYQLTCFTECGAMLTHMGKIRQNGMLMAAIVFFVVMLCFALPLKHILNRIIAFVQYVSEYPASGQASFVPDGRSIVRRVTAYFITLLCASTLAFNMITINQTLAVIRQSVREINQSFVENQRYALNSLSRRSREAVAYVIYSSAFQSIVQSSGATAAMLPYEQYAYLSTLKCDVNLYDCNGTPVFYMSLANLSGDAPGSADEWRFGGQDRLGQPVIRYTTVMRATAAGGGVMPLQQTGRIEIVFPQSYLDALFESMASMQLEYGVVSSDGSLIASNLPSQDVSFTGRDWIAVQTPGIPVTIYARETDRAIAGVSGPFMRMSTLVIGGLLCLCALFAAGISAFFRRQTDRLVQQLERIDRNGCAEGASDPLQRCGISEIERLYSAFQSMAGRIDELIKVEYAAKLKEALLINERNEIEMASLQAQINPHFIYNTLDAIKWLMLQERKADCERALNALARLMRYSTMVNRPLVTVVDEMRMLQAYSEIQGFRLDATPEIVFRVYPGVRKNAAIRMILQPILENAYTHAFAGRPELGVILITARESDEDVEIRVEDNGIGMDAAQLSRVRQKIQWAGESADCGVGLYNVNRRIRLYFGEDYGLTLDSTPGEGTCVTVRLPKTDVETVQDRLNAK